MASGSDISWVKDEISTQATTIPEIIEEQSYQITTVVIFVISAILTITLLFVIAVFIDCRQEKLQRLQTRQRPKRVLKMKLPIGVGRAVREDEATLADKMQECEPSSSNNVIV